MATHSRILAWRTPGQHRMTKSPMQLSVHALSQSVNVPAISSAVLFPLLGHSGWLHFPAFLEAGVSTWMSFSPQLPAVVQKHRYMYRRFLPFPNSTWRQRSEGIWRHLIQETKLSSSITDLTELWCKWEIDFYFLQLLRSWSWSSSFWIRLSQFTSSCLESLLIQVNMPVPLTITLMAWIQPSGLSPVNTFYFACMTLKVVSTKWSSSSAVGHDQCRRNRIITFSSRCYGNNDEACDAYPLSLFFF